MARAKPAQPVPPKLQLDPESVKRGIGRLGDRINELQAFDVQTTTKGDSPALEALCVAINDTLARCFGDGTSTHERFKEATELSWGPSSIYFFGGPTTPEAEYRKGVGENIARSVALLQAAQQVLNEDLADAQHEATALPAPAAPEAASFSRRVFVVHGHDGEARETVARYLHALGFEPVILHEQANQGRTVIEKIEAQSDVKFAVVLLTPDDMGRSVKEDELKPRARQNVLLELGYFIGKLGGDKVCALKRGHPDIPSDFAGVVWEKMDDGGGWKVALARELKAAGHEVDLNKAFSL